jgi:hypothetical protein
LDKIIVAKNENNLKNYTGLVYCLCIPKKASSFSVSVDQFYLVIIKRYLKLDDNDDKTGLIYALDVSLFIICITSVLRTLSTGKSFVKVFRDLMSCLPVNIEHLVFFTEAVQYADQKLLRLNPKKHEHLMFSKLKDKSHALIKLIIQSKALNLNEKGKVNDLK